MEYVNYTNKPCRVFIYTNPDFKDHIAMIKFNSLAEAYRYLSYTTFKDKNTPPCNWKNICSLTSFRKVCKEHKSFKGSFATNKLFSDRFLYYFSLHQTL